MKQFIYKLLDVEEAQATRVFLMLGMGFFMGIFLATLDVGALSLFLQTFDEGKDLPMAFLLSGVVGIILISIYNFFQSRIPYASLSIISLLAMTIILLGLQFGIKTIADPKNVYFAAFVIVLPFNYLTLLLFWGTFGRIFTLRESKKIIGSIDTGQLIASILALFSIPILLQILEVTDLLSISLLAQGGVLLMVAIIALKKLHAVGGHKRVGRISYPKMLRSKYIVLMAAFVIVSMITISFVDYAFLSATAQQFSPTALPTFLSLFEATVVIFSFLFQTFVTDKVIAQYGLRVALIINPMLIGLFTGIAVFMGIFFGYIKEGNDTFIFFFIIIAMSKLFIDALKDALDGPSFKLYFLPVDTSIRFDVQTKVEGIVTAFAGVLAGLLIITINNVEFFTLLYITIFSLPLLAMWYIITNKMHEGYKSTLQNTLVRNKESQDIEVRQEFSVNQVLENEIKSNKESNIIYSLRLMEKLEPAMFESSIIQMVNSAEGKVREYSLGKIHSLNLQYDKDNEVHQLALKAAGEADDFDAISLPADKLEKMGKSLQKEDRLVAARVLRTMMDDKTIFLLLELLRDIDNEVRLEAIITARKVKRPETWSVLIEMLDSPNFGHAANSALIVAGEDALHTLEMAFHKSGQRDKIMLKIISIIGRIGGEKSLELLWKKIDYPDKRISSQVLVWLRYFNYQARTERERQTLFELLDDDIAKAIWNMSALVELPDQEHFKLLKESLEEEVGANYAHIFMLLSILYDPNSIQLVRENIESGSSEGITFAIELMDIFVDKEVKPKLFPLFDDIETIDKLRQLQVFFPREEYTANEVLNFILNRNFDQANRWTKACALHALAFMDDFKVTKAMVAQLFNPDYLLQETAAWVIYHKEKTIFEKVAIRLPEEDRKFLENSISRNQLIEGLDDGAFLRIEMAMFMKEVPLLSAIRGALLCDIADHMQVIQLAANEEYILSDQLENKPILVIAGGEVELTYNEMEKTNLQVKDVFGDLFVLDANLEARHLQAITDSIIFSISATDFYTIMGDNLGLVQDMIAGMTTQFEKEKILT